MVIYRVWYVTRYLEVTECPRYGNTLSGQSQALVLSLNRGNASSRIHACRAVHISAAPRCPRPDGLLYLPKQSPRLDVQLVSFFKIAELKMSSQYRYTFILSAHECILSRVNNTQT